MKLFCARKHMLISAVNSSPRNHAFTTPFNEMIGYFATLTDARQLDAQSKIFVLIYCAEKFYILFQYSLELLLLLLYYKKRLLLL